MLGRVKIVLVFFLFPFSYTKYREIIVIVKKNDLEIFMRLHSKITQIWRDGIWYISLYTKTVDLFQLLPLLNVILTRDKMIKWNFSVYYVFLY